MPRAKQLTVWVPDQPGTLGEIATALGEKKANILGITASTAGGQGTIRLVVDRTAVAKKLFAARGWQATEEEVLELTLGHTPGTLGKVASKLGKAGVNIEYLYGGPGVGARKATAYFGVSDLKAALKAAR